MYPLSEEDIKNAKELIPRLAEEMSRWITYPIWAKVCDEYLYKTIGRPHNPDSSIHYFWMHLIDEAVKERGNCKG